METKEQLNQRLQELLDARESLLRGFGQRYSRRFKTAPFDKDAHGDQGSYVQWLKRRVKNSKANIKKAKVKMVQLSDEIADIKQKIKELDLQNTKSSPQFNDTYKTAIRDF